MFRTRHDGPNVIICVHLSSETGVVSAIAGWRDLLGDEGGGVILPLRYQIDFRVTFQIPK
jgi:hypothetical protein